jgi:hypothetical protein
LNGDAAAVGESEMTANEMLSGIVTGARMHLEMFCFIEWKVEG